MSRVREQWKKDRLALKRVKCDREVEMVLEKFLQGGPFLIQACKDAQLYGVYEVPLLLPKHLEHHAEPMMEDLLETEGVRVMRRHFKLRELLSGPLTEQAQAEIAKIKEELELEALQPKEGE